MSRRFGHIALLRAALLLAASLPLAGCGALNTGLSSMIADNLPSWAGGLPKDAPPRPGDPGYEAYEREQQAKALMGAPPAATPATQTGQPSPQPTPAVVRPQATKQTDDETGGIRPQGRGVN